MATKIRASNLHTDVTTLIQSLGGSSSLDVLSKTDNYTISTGDNGKLIVLTSGNFKIFTLPSASSAGSGWYVKIQNQSGNSMTVNKTGSDTLNNGATSFVLSNGGAIELVSNGSSLFYLRDKSLYLFAEHNRNNGSFAPTATGLSSIAIGRSASATGQTSLALGTSSNFDGSVAIGSSSVAIAGSYASGADSFAASTTNNTSSYGALGANSIAIGNRTKSSATASTSLGYWAQATGQISTAIGAYTYASGSRSFAFGNDTEASHSYSMSLGEQVSSTASYQVNVGGSTQDVRISETYTLPKVDGTSGQSLTTDGSGVVSWATAGGGVTGFTSADNTSSPNNTVNVASLTASSSSTNAGIAIVPKGTGSFSLAIPDGTAAGGNARGSQAIELSLGRSGADRVASGTKSIGIGYNAKANGSGGVAISGSGNICQGQNGVALGYDSNVYGSYSTVINAGGSGTDGGSSYALALGNGSKAGAEGSGAVIRGYTETKNTFAVGTKDKLYTQRVTGNLYGITTDATSATISTKGLNQTVSKANFPTISAGDSAWGLYAATIKGTLHALDDTNNEIRVWEFCRSFKLHDNVKSAVGNTVKNLLVSDGTTMANTDFSIELSGSTRTIIFTVTGVASTNIRWNAHYTIYQTKYE